MNEGYSKGTGHYIEFRPNPKQWKFNNVWNEEKKQFEKVEATFGYCIYCNTWGWALKPICPENFEVITKPEVVPAGIKEKKNGK